MRQSTLSFQSSKRTESAPDGKSQQKSLAMERGKNVRTGTSAGAQDDVKYRETVEIPSTEEEAAAMETTVPSKRTRASTKARLSSGTTKQIPSKPPQLEEQGASPQETDREHLDVQDKAGRYRNYYNEVRSKMGYIKPIHSEGQNKIHQMLRLFDMSYEFGPCIGITRLERWERAEAFGLNPPAEVRGILLTKEGMENPEYAQCVLHGEI